MININIQKLNLFAIDPQLVASESIKISISGRRAINGLKRDLNDDHLNRAKNICSSLTNKVNKLCLFLSSTEEASQLV